MTTRHTVLCVGFGDVVSNRLTKAVVRAFLAGLEVLDCDWKHAFKHWHCFRLQRKLTSDEMDRLLARGRLEVVGHCVAHAASGDAAAVVTLRSQAKEVHIDGLFGLPASFNFAAISAMELSLQLKQRPNASGGVEVYSGEEEASGTRYLLGLVDVCHKKLESRGGESPEGMLPHWAGPDTIDFDLARSMVGLASPGQDKRILDPCAGTGTIPIVASWMGHRAIASEPFELRGLIDQLRFLGLMGDRRQKVLKKVLSQLGDSTWCDSARSLASEVIRQNNTNTKIEELSYPQPEIWEAVDDRLLGSGSRHPGLESIIPRMAFYLVRRACFEAERKGPLAMDKTDVPRQLSALSAQIASLVDVWPQLDLTRIKALRCDVQHLRPVPGTVDSIVTDPPYGLAERLDNKTLRTIYDEIIRLGLNVLPCGGRVVLASLKQCHNGQPSSHCVFTSTVVDLIKENVEKKKADSKNKNLRIGPLRGMDSFEVASINCGALERGIVAFEVLETSVTDSANGVTSAQNPLCPSCNEKNYDNNIPPYISSAWLRCPRCGEYAFALDDAWIVTTPPYPQGSDLADE